MFWVDRNDEEDARTFIVDNRKQYSFSQVFEMGDEFYNNFSRGVVIIECKSDLETIILYCGALRRKIVPLLIDSNSPESFTIEMAARFEAEYICSKKILSSPYYLHTRTIGSFRVYERKVKIKKKISNDLALLLPTSGSTGDPKCVRLSAKNIASATKSIVRYMKMSSSRVSISSLPLHYAYGLSVLHNAIESRSKFVLTELSWIDREFWNLANENGLTDLSGVPFMFEILRRIRLSDSLVKSLKCVNQAGGRLDPKLITYFLDRFKGQGVEFLTMYGQTEASPRISYVPNKLAEGKVGTVGRPIDIGAIETDAPDKKSEGELIYMGPNVCLGYAKDREDLFKGDNNNGILLTGDIGFIDEDGFITITGRKKRFAKIYGISVNLDELESLAKSFERNVAVVSNDDLIVVFVAKDITEELRAHLLEKVSFPARCLQCVRISEIPHQSSGKPDYQKLVREFL